MDRRAGTTLIELLIALALVGIVMAAAVTLLLQSAANAAASREQNAAQQNARGAADAVTDDLRGAVGDSLPATPPADPNPSSPLIFTVYDAAGAARTIRYWRDTGSGDLYRQPGNESPVAVARHISGFRVSCADSTITVTVTATLGSAPLQSSVTVCADVVPRNRLG